MFLIITAVLALFTSFGTADEISCKDLPGIMQNIMSRHYLGSGMSGMSEELTDRAVVNVVRSASWELSDRRILLTQDDLQELKPIIKNYFKKVSQGETPSCDLIVPLRQTLAKRATRMSGMVLDASQERSTRVDLWEPFAKDELEFESRALDVMSGRFAAMKARGFPVDQSLEEVKSAFLALANVLGARSDEYLLSLVLDGFAKSLDSQSKVFLARDRELRMMWGRQATFPGLGIDVLPLGLYPEITQISPGGEAFMERQIQVGDRIVSIRIENKEFGLEGARELDLNMLLRMGKVHRLKLRRLESGNEREFFVDLVPTVRAIRTQEVSSNYSEVRTIERDGKKIKLGKVHLGRFSVGSSFVVKNLIASVIREGVSGVILDLSDNPGGLRSEAVHIAGLFLKLGSICNSVDALGGTTCQVDTDPKISYGGPLVILMNSQSASASEIVAQALKDYRRAVVVGDPASYGKGCVGGVSEFGINQGFMTIVTNSLYFGPSGKSPQIWGVPSDVVINSEAPGGRLADCANPLPSGETAQFMSPNEVTGAGTVWTPVSDKAVEELQKRSESRTRENRSAEAYEVLADWVEIGTRKR